MAKDSNRKIDEGKKAARLSFERGHQFIPIAPRSGEETEVIKSKKVFVYVPAYIKHRTHRNENEPQVQ